MWSILDNIQITYNPAFLSVIFRPHFLFIFFHPGYSQSTPELLRRWLSQLWLFSLPSSPLRTAVLRFLLPQRYGLPQLRRHVRLPRQLPLLPHTLFLSIFKNTHLFRLRFMFLQKLFQNPSRDTFINRTVHCSSASEKPLCFC